MATSDYRMFDVDNHYYESHDAFTRYLEPEYRGRFKLGIGGKEGRRTQVVRPGSLGEYLRKLKSGDAEEPYTLMDPLPGFHQRDARLALMDEQGIEACTMFSSAVSIEHKIDEPKALYAHFRALNRWIEDECCWSSASLG